MTRVVLFLLAMSALPVLAEEPEVWYELVLAEHLAKPDAERSMKEASRKLAMSFAPETLADPPGELLFAGEILCVQVEDDGRFRLTADLDQVRSKVESVRSRVLPVFPAAEVRQVARAPYAVSYRHELKEIRIFILAASKSFAEAEARAKEIGGKSGTRYATRGLAYDDRRGLVYPDGARQKELRGLYYPRQDNACGAYMTACDGCWADECLSIERSDYYPDLAPGLYLVVSGVDYGISYDFARKYRAIAPDSYAKKTRIFAGILEPGR